MTFRVEERYSTIYGSVTDGDGQWYRIKISQGSDYNCFDLTQDQARALASDLAFFFGEREPVDTEPGPEAPNGADLALEIAALRNTAKKRNAAIRERLTALEKGLADEGVYASKYAELSKRLDALEKLMGNYESVATAVDRASDSIKALEAKLETAVKMLSARMTTVGDEAQRRTRSLSSGVEDMWSRIRALESAAPKNVLESVKGYVDDRVSSAMASALGMASEYLKTIKGE